MLIVLLSTMAPVSITIVLMVFAELSRRLGAVVKRSPLHRWFYFGAFFSGISTILRLLSLRYTSDELQGMHGNETIVILYSGTLALSILIGLVIAWQYWGWLVYASDGQTPIPGNQNR